MKTKWLREEPLPISIRRLRRLDLSRKDAKAQRKIKEQEIEKRKQKTENRIEEIGKRGQEFWDAGIG